MKLSFLLDLMPDSDISNSQIIKGGNLEDVIEIFLNDLKNQLDLDGVKSVYVKGDHYPGQGKPNIDFLFVIRSRKDFYYYLYIEAKNWVKKQRSAGDVDERIMKKFEFLSDWKKIEPSEKKIGLVVGNFIMSKQDIERLQENNIHYLHTGEIGYTADKSDIILYNLFLRGKLLQYMALHTKDVFEQMPSKYQFEIIDEKKFVIRRSKSLVEYNTDDFEKIDYMPVDADNLMNFFTITKGKRGGIIMLSPWKGTSNNPDISIRHYKRGTTLYVTKWGKRSYTVKPLL
ncbi:MAG: hypothetical protein KGI19_08815 [Thaumarchaeota archaeon]|nr:hypothetical protein [Nitrososphaerota archaeon]